MTEKAGKCKKCDNEGYVKADGCFGCGSHGSSPARDCMCVVFCDCAEGAKKRAEKGKKRTT